jgi:hypothetical protein
MATSNKVKPKIYSIWLNNRKAPDKPDLLIRAQTKQGAIAHAAAQTITCEYADQNMLYEATKAGVTRIDVAADPAQNVLPGVEAVANA